MILITENIENIFEGHETVRTKIEIVRTIKTYVLFRIFTLFTKIQ